MYILTRYVVWEVLKYFLAAVVALTLVVTPVMAIKEGLSEGLPAMVMLRIMPFILPEMLGITIPASMLFSVCSVFGRMTGANEVVALKSLGISPMAAVWPAIVLACFLSLGTVWMYEIAATWCKPTVWRIGFESIEEIAYGMLRKNRSFDRDKFPFSAVVKRVDKPLPGDDRPRLIQPMITIKGPPRISIWADEATLRTVRKDGQLELQIECTAGVFDYGGRTRMSFSDEQKFPVPITVPTPPLDHRDWVALRDIPRLVAGIQAQLSVARTALQQLERQSQANQARGVPPSAAEAEQIAAQNTQINDCLFRIRRLKTEPYRRWANGFACLCFALMGIPVAMLWRHADVLTNFFVCFLPILAIYYPLLLLSDHLSTTSGQLPPISFWMANAVLVTPAIALMRWIVRH